MEQSPWVSILKPRTARRLFGASFQSNYWEIIVSKCKLVSTRSDADGIILFVINAWPGGIYITHGVLIAFFNAWIRNLSFSWVQCFSHPLLAAHWFTVGKLLLCVYTILPFCWKASDFVSHSIDRLVIVISHIRFFEVPCSQCIDGRYMGQLVTNYCLWWGRCFSRATTILYNVTCTRVYTDLPVRTFWGIATIFCLPRVNDIDVFGICRHRYEFYLGIKRH